ncbi:hypothetical protein F1D61_00200 [Methylobacterium aquaticum]|nr:hypothetical protein F1D61_00200 [Methylobacterium aquaticum]
MAAPRPLAPWQYAVARHTRAQVRPNWQDACRAVGRAEGGDHAERNRAQESVRPPGARPARGRRRPRRGLRRSASRPARRDG